MGWGFRSDTRYQLASEAVDQRHMGEDPDEIPKADLAERKSIDEYRKEWGLESRMATD
jgi:hypothetical protein